VDVARAELMARHRPQMYSMLSSDSDHDDRMDTPQVGMQSIGNRLRGKPPCLIEGRFDSTKTPMLLPGLAHRDNICKPHFSMLCTGSLELTAENCSQ